MSEPRVSPLIDAILRWSAVIQAETGEKPKVLRLSAPMHDRLCQDLQEGRLADVTLTGDRVTLHEVNLLGIRIVPKAPACRCDEVQADDFRRHFKGCPMRDVWPEADAHKELQRKLAAHEAAARALAAANGDIAATVEAVDAIIALVKL